MTENTKNEVPRRIYPEDHEELRKLAFFKRMTYIEVLNEIFAFSKEKDKDIDYYLQYKKHDSPSIKHKSVRIPSDLNEYLNKKSNKKITAKQLLSAIIRDYVNNARENNGV